MVNQIFIQGADMPSKVRCVTIAAPDDDFMVFVNTNLCPDTQAKAAAHEIRHIRLDHFYNQEPVVINEIEAH